MKGFVLGVVVTIVVIVAAAYLYFAKGMAPAATSAAPMPFERKLAHMALHARLEKEMPTQVPVPADEGNLLAGAPIYIEQCAVCHGIPGQDQSAIAQGEFPPPPHLFRGKGVTDDEPGETYWKVANGIRLTGMPGFNQHLSTREMWQVSLLVANADKLPAAARAVLTATATAQSAPSLYKQVARFKVGGEGGWDYVTYDAGSNRLFVGHSNEITVIDATTGQKVGSVPANGAHGVAVIPEKNLGFSTNGRAGTVTVFDLKTLQTKKEIKAGENPDAVIYDPYARKVIVMNGRSKDVMVIDPDALEVVATVPLGGKLEAATSDPGHVYVNVEDAGEIASIDSKTWKEDHRWKLTGCEEPSGMGIDERKHRLFSVCGNKKMAVVDAASGQVLATLDTGEGTDGAGFDPRLGYALASNGGDGTLTVVRESKDGKYAVAENVPTQRGARTMAVDPKSHRVFLPTAELGPPAQGQRWPSVKPGSFVILVYAPSK